jgi:hypothetical protein
MSEEIIQKLEMALDDPSNGMMLHSMFTLI